MFGNEKKGNKKFDKEKVETILGAGTKIDGNINTKGSLRVEGTVVGEIKVEGDLFVGEEAKIKTKVEARNVIVAGKIEGNITAQNKLEILPTGKVAGDIEMKTIKIEEGAKFEGNSKILNDSMNGSKQKKETSKTKKEKK
ncbi:MAG: bactofilin family protein [Bacillota bacterium]